MRREVKIVLIGILVILLMAVRAYGTKFFYDPFIQYFENDYLKLGIPSHNTFKLFLNLFLRYVVNSIISLGIIYVAFQKRTLIIFSVKFYIAAFFILSISYYLLLKVGFENGHLLGFYVRRFLIHPVFVLILLPAFYYQKKLVKSATKS